MTKRELRRIEMMRRVLSCRTNWQAAPVGAEQAFERVARAIREVEEADVTVLTESTSRANRRVEARAALLRSMEAIARTVHVLALTMPGVDAPFQVPSRQSDATLLAAARTFVHEGQPLAASLTPFGLPSTCILDLQALVEAFEQAIHAQRLSRTHSQSARKAQHTAMGQGLEAVQILDVIVANTFGDQPTFTAVWEHARRIGPRRRSAETQMEPSGGATTTGSLAGEPLTETRVPATR